MPSILIMGSSQGVGLEFVKYYKRSGYDVITTTSHINSADELRALLNGKDDLIIEMDVTDPHSVKMAMQQIMALPFKTAVYCCGFKGYTKIDGVKATLSNATFMKDGVTSRELGRKLAFEINAHGFDRVMETLHTKLLNNKDAIVVYISTGVADIAQNTSGGYPFYRESKIAGEAYVRGRQIGAYEEADSKDACMLVVSIVPGILNVGMGAKVPGAANPAKRIADIDKVIQHIRKTRDTHGVWKYDCTKFVTYPLPDIFKPQLAPSTTLPTDSRDNMKNILGNFTTPPSSFFSRKIPTSTRSTKEAARTGQSIGCPFS